MAVAMYRPTGRGQHALFSCRFSLELSLHILLGYTADSVLSMVGECMSHIVQLGENGLVPLPDELCEELGIDIGDILICEVTADTPAISMTKHHIQTLSDKDIAAAGNLVRVIPHTPDQESATE